MASYAYYILDKSIMPDSEYDSIAKTLLEHWDSFEHPHKYLLTKDDLRAGTAFAIKEYPNRVKYAVEQFLRETP
jgi:NAD-dependent DNA ligase